MPLEYIKDMSKFLIGKLTTIIPRADSSSKMPRQCVLVNAHRK